MRPTSLSLLAAATRGRLLGEASDRFTVERVEIDSRNVTVGSVFWALPGEHHDGHAFVAEAFRRGAIAAVIQERQLDQVRAVLASEGATTTTLIVVNDPLAALADFAGWHRSQFGGVVIGVTGSYGKTTTREMIHAVLSSQHASVRSLKNFNNHIGLPLSLLELDASHEFAVIEMGASAVGEIAALSEIAKPTVGVITGIGLAHVSGFGSPERIVLGKGELLEALPIDGLAVLPADDSRACGMSNRTRARAVLVGESDEGNVRASHVRVANQRLTFEVDGFKYSVPVTGRHFLRAALTALAIAREAGLSPQQVDEGFQNFRSAPGRCEVRHVGSWTVIDDSYNANPTSMRAACATLRDWETEGKRLLVTGDMLELGEHAESAHHDLGQAAANARVDALLILGNHAQQVALGAISGGMRDRQVVSCDNIAQLLIALDAVLAPNDVLLVKGSRGMHMERVIEWLQQQVSQPTNSNFTPFTPPHRSLIV